MKKATIRSLQTAVALLVAMALTGCDVHWHDDDDDYLHTVVQAEMTVQVRDYDYPDVVLPNATVRVYGDHGWHWDLDLNDTYVLAVTDSNGEATVAVQAVLSHPDQCIALWAEAEFDDEFGYTDVVRYWYPAGGSYSTVIYVDNTYSDAPRGDILEVPTSDYPTIQDALTAARNGDWIYVDVGLYEENLDFHGKDVAVISKFGPDWTVIDGGVKEPAVHFHSGETRQAALRGFTIIGGKPGIRIGNAAPSLDDNLILSDTEGDIFAAQRRGAGADAVRLELQRPRPARSAINLGKQAPKRTAPYAWMPLLMLGLLALILLATTGYCLHRYRP